MKPARRHLRRLSRGLSGAKRVLRLCASDMAVATMGCVGLVCGRGREDLQCIMCVDTARGDHGTLVRCECVHVGA